MRILNISAQKPDSTGSGTYLSETSRAMEESGHDVAMIAGIDVSDDPCIPEGVRFYPVRYNTESLPFPVCGMSDVMPYEATRYRDMTPEMVYQFKSAFQREYIRALEEFRPDIVICHHLYLALAAIMEAGTDVPVCAVSHSTDLRQFKSHPLERESITKAVQSLTHVFALHNEQAKEIADMFDIRPDMISVVGTGYNDGLFHLAEDFRARQGSETSGIVPVTLAFA
ncbi:MAG: glycosyltransferase family 4 protein [Eggerthellaceae bacterium]|nr:glycosyltransferase family 4 protein [Eggerthellaceae bacterium]